MIYFARGLYWRVINLYVEYTKYVAVAVQVVYWSYIAFIFRTKGMNPNKSISDHVAGKDVRRVFVPLVSAIMIIFAGAILFWLLLNVEAHWTAYLFMSLALVSELVTTFIPRQGSSIVVHDASASLAGLSVLFMYISLAQSAINGFLLGLIWSVVAVMVIVALFLTSQARKNYLFYQLAFYLVFNVSVSIIMIVV